MEWINDKECELMKYCLKQKGKWWANHFFRNKEVDDLYIELRSKPLEEVNKVLL